MKRLALSLIALFLLIGDASAASKFWVGGGTNTNWAASPVTNWANTSGGAGNQTIPVAGDSVFFDGNSGTGVALWNTSISLATLNATGSKNVVTQGASITISSGDYILPTGVGGSATANTSSFVIFTGTTGTQLFASNGFTTAPLNVNAPGATVQLQDNVATLASGGGGLTLTAGTLDLQSFSLSGQTFSSSNSNVRAIKGSGGITVGTGNATGNLWTTTTSTNMDVSLFTGTIFMTGTTGGARSIASGGLTTLKLNLAGNTAAGLFGLTTSATYNSFTVAGPSTIQITTGNTFTNPPVFNGTSGNEIFVLSNVMSSSATISVPSGTMNATWTAFRDIAFSGGATFTADNSFDMGHNSGITFNGGSGGACILGGWLLWRDLPSYDRLPEIFDHEPANDNSPAFLGKTG